MHRSATWPDASIQPNPQTASGRSGGFASGSAHLCACRKLRPRRSGRSVVVLVDDACEAVVSAYVQPGALSRIAAEPEADPSVASEF